MGCTRRAVLGAAFVLPALRARADDAKLIYTAAPIADELPVYLARERGIFARHGLDVTTVTGNGTTIPAVLLSGGAQIGSLPPTTLLQVTDAGIDLVVIAAADATPHDSAVALVVSDASPVKTPQDLRGRRIAVPGLNGTFHVLARTYLERNHLDDGSVQFIEVPYPQMIDAFRGKAVDAATLPRPYLDRLLEMKAGWVMAELVRGTVPDGTVNMVHTATRAWATTHTAEIVAFRESLGEAIALIHSDPDGARAELAAFTHLPPQVVATLPFLNYGWRMAPHGLDFWIAECLRQGMIGKAPDAAKLLLA
jgi:NitT/TauT family transport system substrate-binding protein